MCIRDRDDVHALAVVDPILAMARPLPLDLPGPLVRAKEDKADFEACCLLPDGTLLVVGSGSRATRRVAFAVDTHAHTSKLLYAAPFYDAIDAGVRRFGGTTNIEGLSFANDSVSVLHRGPGMGEKGGRCALLRIPTEDVLRALFDDVAIPEEHIKAAPVDIGTLDGLSLIHI